MKLNSIANYLPRADFNQLRKTSPWLLISLIVSGIFFLYRYMQPSVISLPRIDFFTKKNLEAIKQNSYLTRLLFRGALDKQEGIARKMAYDLGIPFHVFDGRNLNENIGKFNKLMQRIATNQKPEFVFVSHADKICETDKLSRNIILVNTGSVSQYLLLCLGVSSDETLPPNLADRYGSQIIVGE